MPSGCSSGTIVACGAAPRGTLLTGTSGVLADQTYLENWWVLLGCVVKDSAPPTHTHTKGPRAQWHKKCCGMLGDGTKGGENHIRAGSGDHGDCGMAAEGTGSALATGKTIRSGGWLGHLLVCMCVSVCEAARDGTIWG